MTTLRTIGILGGMGPQATILLQQKLIDAVNASDDASHIPLLVDMNPQVPSRLTWILEQRGDDPGPVLADMARALEQHGAQALAMPCNTAHYFADAIREAVATIPFIDMVALSAQRMAQYLSPGATVGILASPATREIELFSQAFAQHNLNVVYPRQLDTLLQIIRRIKSTGASEQERQALADTAQDCMAQGASGLLVGCSEFSLIADAIGGELPMIDTLDILVQAIVDHSELDPELYIKGRFI